jgi:hypothetical protein
MAGRGAPAVAFLVRGERWGATYGGSRVRWCAGGGRPEERRWARAGDRRHPWASSRRRCEKMRTGSGQSERGRGGVMSTHASILIDSVGPPSTEVCRTAASFP